MSYAPRRPDRRRNRARREYYSKPDRKTFRSQFLNDIRRRYTVSRKQHFVLQRRKDYEGLESSVLEFLQPGRNSAMFALPIHELFFPFFSTDPTVAPAGHIIQPVLSSSYTDCGPAPLEGPNPFSGQHFKDFFFKGFALEFSVLAASDVAVRVLLLREDTRTRFALSQIRPADDNPAILSGRPGEELIGAFGDPKFRGPNVIDGSFSQPDRLFIDATSTAFTDYRLSDALFRDQEIFLDERFVVKSPRWTNTLPDSDITKPFKYRRYFPVSRTLYLQSTTSDFVPGTTKFFYTENSKEPNLRVYVFFYRPTGPNIQPLPERWLRASDNLIDIANRSAHHGDENVHSQNDSDREDGADDDDAMTDIPERHFNATLDNRFVPRRRRYPYCHILGVKFSLYWNENQEPASFQSVYDAPSRVASLEQEIGRLKTALAVQGIPIDPQQVPAQTAIPPQSGTSHPPPLSQSEILSLPQETPEETRRKKRAHPTDYPKDIQEVYEARHAGHSRVASQHFRATGSRHVPGSLTQYRTTSTISGSDEEESDSESQSRLESDEGDTPVGTQIGSTQKAIVQYQEELGQQGVTLSQAFDSLVPSGNPLDSARPSSSQSSSTSRQSRVTSFFSSDKTERPPRPPRGRGGK